MEINQKSLGVFIHFSDNSEIPLYVRIYLQELSQHFDEVILIANLIPDRKKDLNLGKNISVMLVENEGYDLGKFYKAFQTIQLIDYHQIACINDSNILFNKLQPIFDWSKKHEFDFWGLIDSNEKPWFSSHSNNYHIQSHFIVFNRLAIDKLPEYFKTIDFSRIFNEKDKDKLRQTVINDWEIGLTQFFISKGLTHGTYIDSQAFIEEYSSGKKGNITHKLYKELIQSGYPLIKKKVISQNKWMDSMRLVLPWETLIRKYGNVEWEIEPLIDELVKIRDDSGKKAMVRFRKIFHKTFKT